MLGKRCFSINAANYTEKPVGWYIIMMNIKKIKIKIITFICVQMFNCTLGNFDNKFSMS